jgi:hypothetical protein
MLCRQHIAQKTAFKAETAGYCFVYVSGMKRPHPGEGVMSQQKDISMFPKHCYGGTSQPCAVVEYEFTP